MTRYQRSVVALLTVCAFSLGVLAAGTLLGGASARAERPAATVAAADPLEGDALLRPKLVSVCVWEIPGVIIRAWDDGRIEFNDLYDDGLTPRAGVYGEWQELSR